MNSSIYLLILDFLPNLLSNSYQHFYSYKSCNQINIELIYFIIFLYIYETFWEKTSIRISLNAKASTKKFFSLGWNFWKTFERADNRFGDEYNSGSDVFVKTHFFQLFGNCLWYWSRCNAPPPPSFVLRVYQAATNPISGIFKLGLRWRRREKQFGCGCGKQHQRSPQRAPSLRYYPAGGLDR